MNAVHPPESCKVYTPGPLAAAMVRAIGPAADATWLEPCHGRGVFLEALSVIGVARKNIVAIDLDRATSTADRLARTFRGKDFLEWSRRTSKRFTYIVGNPPYVQITHLPSELREVAAATLDSDGQPIGLGANTWYAFVLSSIRLLAPHGALAFVLPSAAEYAEYSRAIRVAVKETFRSVELFRCRRPLFSEVREGTIVAIARDYGSGPCLFRRREFSTPEELIAGLEPTRVSPRRPCGTRCADRREDGLLFRDLASIHLGGVTGDARYFLLSEAQRREAGLPCEALVPVVTRARHIQASMIGMKVWQSLRDGGERVWLFNPDEYAIKSEPVRRYLGRRPEEGGCRRTAFKVMCRSPWYRTPLPQQPHAFISGMSQHGPWLCINEMNGLNATNTLYVVTFHDGIGPEEWPKIGLAMLSSDVQRQLRRVVRHYADGLLKYEPGALSRVRLPVMRSNLDYRTIYRGAVRLLVSGERRLARGLADDAVSR